MYEAMLPDGGEPKQKSRVVCEESVVDIAVVAMRAKAIADEKQTYFVSGNMWTLLRFGIVGDST